MRRAVLTAAAAAAFALAACTGGPDAVSGRAAPVDGTAAASPSAGPGSAGTPPAGSGSTGTSSATVPPSATPPSTAAGPAAGPAAVPASVMLRSGDWPEGRIRRSTTGLAGLEQTEPSACQQHTAYPSDRYRLAARSVSVASDEPESGGVREDVVRYAPGRAVQAMAEMRRVLAACRGYRPAPEVSPPMSRRYALTAERFAGDDSLLVLRADRTDGETREWGDYISVVRLGDALVVTSSEIGEGVADLTVARRLADVGARRAACLRSSC